MKEEYWKISDTQMLRIENNAKLLKQQSLELKKAKALIARLRAENRCLKEEKAHFIEHGNGLLKLWCKIGVKTKTFIPPYWSWNFENQRML